MDFERNKKNYKMKKKNLKPVWIKIVGISVFTYLPLNALGLQVGAVSENCNLIFGGS